MLSKIISTITLAGRRAFLFAPSLLALNLLEPNIMSKKDKQSSFLTDKYPEQTLENCHRMLDLLSYLNRVEPMNDYAEAGVCMILHEVGKAFTDLGDNYNFVKKEAGGAS